MAFDTFISYSNQDKTAADAACAVLERAGIRCWIAPRDIRPGGEYGGAIIEAIDQCRVMVLIFSSSANQSQQIHREIERAVSKGIPIVPVRIEEVTPTKSMEYFLGAIHWLDALTPPLENHLQRLGETVKALLQVDVPACAIASSDNRGVALDTVARAAAAKRDRGTGWLLGQRLFIPALGVAFIALLIGGTWYYLREPALQPSIGSSSPQPARSRAETLVPETVPFISDRERVALRRDYLPAPGHKALAINNVRSAFRTGQKDEDTAKTAALAACDRFNVASEPKCEVYAVGNTVVFTRGRPPLPPEPWLIRNHAIERPFVANEVPFLTGKNRTDIENNYLTRTNPKALAISSGGAFARFSNQSSLDEAIRRSLERCGDHAGIACFVVAVDDVFVVPIPTTMKAVGLFRPGTDAAITPEARDNVASGLANAPNSWNAVAVGLTGRPGLIVNAANEHDAVEGALANCNRQDRACHVIAIGPFSVVPRVDLQKVEELGN